ncbi:MAG: hypothetical protein Q4B22_02205 [Eubacteriales bacterium]|nr:hypothetical protein [Eubacteriales bacterium]
MIDIHAHILPGVDDGADSMEMALEMAAAAADSGVRGIAATPHCSIPGEYQNFADASMEERLQRLRNRVKEQKIPIRIYRGMEIFATSELPQQLEDGRVWTINGTTRFLCEFRFDEDPGFCNRILAACTAWGYQPVIAHPERYYFVQEDPQIAFDWCTRGYALQINKGSVLGAFGPEEEYMAHSLLHHGLAACVASDAHKPQWRSTNMGEVYALLRADYGEEYTWMLTEENPIRILKGQDLIGYEPIPYT